MDLLDEDYRDFRAYKVSDDGEAIEIDVDIDKIEELFSSEGVFLFVRKDLRRIFIWKGPRSPVRKRFISSRLASKIQEETSKTGMHLKIVSIDAGDELVDFLNAFNVESYEVSADERPEDMYYLRNKERRELQDAKLKQSRKKKKDEKEEYWSPVLEEQKRMEKMEQAKKKAIKTSEAITTDIKSPEKRKNKKKSSQILKQKGSGHVSSLTSTRPARSFSSRKGKPRNLSHEEEKAVLDLILNQDLPEGMTRQNIVIGTSLFGPKRVISSLFGKEVEEIEWSKVKTIPDGKTEINTCLLRVYCKNNEIEGVEILGEGENSSKENLTPKKDTSSENTDKNTERKLNPIPKGE